MHPKHIVYCGLPIPAFPVELVDANKDSQIVHVPFITIRGITYGSGAYVQIDKVAVPPFGLFEFTLTHVGLQPHLMRKA